MQVETLILGAGAAGLFCAAHAGPGVLVVDHARAPGEKIRISGGGRCNFTNLSTTPAQFLSSNPHFAKSALARFTPRDFLVLVEGHRIAWHEKTLGQLFCDGSATQIVAMLMDLCAAQGAQVWLQTTVGEIARVPDGFRVGLAREGRALTVSARHLVVATGGKSIPKMGATGLAYRIAADFGLDVTETRPALVPFTFAEGAFAALSGVAHPVRARAARGPAFDEALLFTHRGLSGPAMLQVSSYWREGEAIGVDLSPRQPLAALLKSARKSDPKKALGTVLGWHLPARLVGGLPVPVDPGSAVGGLSDAAADRIGAALSGWSLTPTGTEGYRTAEVTLGGVATTGLSARTMMAEGVPGLFFIGEAVDVTGWLGGYNFQWAWASGHAAGTAIRDRGCAAAG
jgi:predicted Rossmann fold flavoprotein